MKDERSKNDAVSSATHILRQSQLSNHNPYESIANYEDYLMKQQTDERPIIDKEKLISGQRQMEKSSKSSLSSQGGVLAEENIAKLKAARKQKKKQNSSRVARTPEFH